MISPIIHRLQPELDAQQRAVLGHLDGPLLVIAGPGAGKTRCIVWRAVNLLLLGLVVPAELVLCTFSRRAAQQLRRRFAVAAKAADCPGDLSAVRITTVHGLCHRILSRHAGSAGRKAANTLLDEFAQLDLMNTHFHRIFGPDRNDLSRRGWRTHEFILTQSRKYFERIAEEAIDPAVLACTDDPFQAALGRCCLRYEAVLRELGALDMARLQIKTDDLLQDETVAGSVGAGIKHIMVDEYQDTGYLQERVLLRLSQVNGNPCVVGDDDQSIYRFRGASVRNLLEFPSRFPDAKVLHLTVNYRSHSGIIAHFDRWMASANWHNPTPGRRPFRYDKVITAHSAGAHGDYPSVISVLGDDREAEGRQLVGLLQRLREQGVIDDYGQVALLLHSVRQPACGHYLAAMNEAGVRYHLAPAASRRGHLGSVRSMPNVSSEPSFPAGQVCVTTIHQAKGLEWPVVVVGSLDGAGGRDDVGRQLNAHSPRPPFEPADRIPDFDRMRQHYVAFSRAQNLLVLTASGPPASHFAPIWGGLPRWPNLDAASLDNLLKQRFSPAISGNAPLSPANLVIDHVQRMVVDLSVYRPAGRGR